MQPENIIAPNPVAAEQPAENTVRNSSTMPAVGSLSVFASTTQQDETPAPQDSEPAPDNSGSGLELPLEDGPGKLKAFFGKHKTQLIIGALVFLLVVNLGISAWLFRRVDHYSALSAVGLQQTASGSNTFNGDNTLYINTKNKAVGVGASTPEGLQVTSDITQTSRGSANVRAGLLNGEPTVILEDKNAQLWQLGTANGSLQVALGATQYLGIDKDGNTNLAKNLQVQGDTTLGASGSNTLTLQSSTVSAPNNLNFASNTLFIDSGKHSVAIGANSANGFKLYVGGNVKADGSIQATGQVTGSAGSAVSPTLAIAGNTNTGIFSPGANIISLSAGGTEYLRVQGGQVSVLNGNLSSSGYIQAGSDSPSWRTVRLTGTLNGSGIAAANHGIDSASHRVVMAMAWYQSGGQAKNLAVDFVSDGQIEVSGGAPGAAWRAIIMYTSDNAGW